MQVWIGKLMCHVGNADEELKKKISNAIFEEADM